MEGIILIPINHLNRLPRTTCSEAGSLVTLAIAAIGARQIGHGLCTILRRRQLMSPCAKWAAAWMRDTSVESRLPDLVRPCRDPDRDPGSATSGSASKGSLAGTLKRLYNLKELGYKTGMACFPESKNQQSGGRCLDSSCCTCTAKT